MRAIPVIVLEVGTYQSDEMAPAEDNDVLKELATVYGFTMPNRLAQPGHEVRRATQKARSRSSSTGRGRSFFSAATCCLNARFSIKSSSRVRKRALRARTLSVIKKMRRRNMAAEFALPVPRSQAPPLGTSSRLAFQSKSLILLADE
jgi:hypothetical protein